MRPIGLYAVRFFARHCEAVRTLAWESVLFYRYANRYLRIAPPYLSFRLAEKKDSAAPGVRKKRALPREYPVGKR